MVGHCFFIQFNIATCITKYAKKYDVYHSTLSENCEDIQNL